jgi:hypothetical protein
VEGFQTVEKANFRKGISVLIKRGKRAKRYKMYKKYFTYKVSLYLFILKLIY